MTLGSGKEVNEMGVGFWIAEVSIDVVVVGGKAELRRKVELGGVVATSDVGTCWGGISRAEFAHLKMSAGRLWKQPHVA